MGSAKMQLKRRLRLYRFWEQRTITGMWHMRNLKQRQETLASVTACEVQEPGQRGCIAFLRVLTGEGGLLCPENGRLG